MDGVMEGFNFHYQEYNILSKVDVLWPLYQPSLEDLELFFVDW
jgi:hypothetical protein